MNLNDLFNEDAMSKVMTPQRQQDLRNQSDYGGEDDDARDQYGNLKRSTSPGLGGTIDIGGVSIPAAAFDAGLGSVAAMGSLGGIKGIFGKSQNTGGTTPGPNTTSTVDLGKKGLPGSDKRWAYQSSEPSTMKVKPFGEPGGGPVNAPAVMRGRDNPKFNPNLSKPDTGMTPAQKEKEAAELMAKMTDLKIQQGKPKINAKDYEAHLAKQKELQQQLKDPRPAVWKDPRTGEVSKSPPPADVEPPASLPYKTPNPAKSKEQVKKERMDAVLKQATDVRRDMWNRMKTRQEKEAEKRRDAWRNPETDVELEEQLVAPATNAATLRSAQGQAAGTAPRGLTPQQQTAFAPHLKTDAATGSQYYDTPDTDPKEVGAMMGTKITTPAAQALVKSPQGQAGVIKHLTAVTDPKNTVNPATTKTTPLSPADAAAAVPDSQQPASEDVHQLRKLSGLTNKDIDEQSRKKRKEPELDYHASGHDQSVERLKHLAGIGPMKTVWDPAKRVYKNVPTADQPPKK